jgi:hypothetical protein
LNETIPDTRLFVLTPGDIEVTSFKIFKGEDEMFLE